MSYVNKLGYQHVFDLRWGNPKIVKHMLRIQRELDRRDRLLEKAEKAERGRCHEAIK